MPKRTWAESRDGLGDNSIVVSMEPLESTALVDTGGSKNATDPIGFLNGVDISSSIASGVRMFHYNRYYWDKDLFAFDYATCAVFIAIAYFDGENRYFAFYPIYLPRVALTTFQNISNLPTCTPATRRYLLKDLVYYLNGGFTSYNYDAITITNPVDYPFFNLPPDGLLQGGPTLFAADKKGYLKNPTSNNPLFPIFQNAGLNGPPLLWTLFENNMQLALIRNPNYEFPAGHDIAFQLVNPNEIYGLGLMNPTNLIQQRVGADIPYQTVLDVSVPATYNGDLAGWMTYAPFSMGFGEAVYSESDSVFIRFSDVYGIGQKERVGNLFSETRLPPTGIPTASIVDFRNWASSRRLKSYIVLGHRIASLLPSRFLLTKSDILSRDQKLRVLSNNPIIGDSTTVGIDYLDLNSIRTRVDGTLSGSNSQAATSSTNSSNGVVAPSQTLSGSNGDSTITHMNPMYSIMFLDLKLIDEWGFYIQNFRTRSGFRLRFGDDFADMTADVITKNGNFIFEIVEGEGADYNNTNLLFTIPPWLAALNPSPVLANLQPLCSPFSQWFSQFSYQLLQSSPAIPDVFGVTLQSDRIPPDFSPNTPISATIIHFGRVLGY